MSRKARTIRLVALVAAAGMVSTIAPSGALGYTSTGTSYPLIVVDNGVGAQQDPRISGALAAYTDDQGGLSSRIEYYDFATGTSGSIPTAAGAIDFLPDVNYENITFTRLSSAGSAIYSYTIGGMPAEVAPVLTPVRRNPAAGDPTIVWEDEGVSSNGLPELVVQSWSVFTGSVTTQLTNDVAADRNPNVSPAGGKIVWEKCINSCDVYAANPGGSGWTTFGVATSGADEIWPDTNGTQIVYASNASGNYHVYVTTPGGTPARLVIPGSVSENHPSISGGFVAFESSNGTQTDIYVYDLATNAVRRITDTTSSEVLSDINSAAPGANTTVTVVWQVIEADANVYASQFVVGAAPAALTLSPAADTNPVGTSHVVTATVQDGSGQVAPNVVVRFSVSGSVTASGQCTSGPYGQCSFAYQGPQLPGADLISAFADTNENGVQDQCLVALGCAGEPDGTATKAWVLPVSTAGEANGGGQINDGSGNKISFGFHASSAGGLQGGCNVVDRSGRMIKCLDVTALVLIGNQATIYGHATDDGSLAGPTTYVIHVVDNASPGKGADTFSLQTAAGYSASGTLLAGNVQVQP
jgi:Tol biopolymer transport system component